MVHVYDVLDQVISVLLVHLRHFYPPPCSLLRSTSYPPLSPSAPLLPLLQMSRWKVDWWRRRQSRTWDH